MEIVRNVDLERQALLEKLSDPDILPILTLGIGKGNFSEATIIADGIEWTRDQGLALSYHSGLVLKLDDFVSSPLDVANLRVLQAGHSIVAGYENAATVYSRMTENGIRRKGVIRPSAAKDIASALAKRPKKEVICTSADVALAILANNPGIKITLLATDMLLRDSALDPRIAAFIIQGERTTSQISSGLNGKDPKIINAGVLTHPVVIEAYDQALRRRNEKFTHPEREVFHALDVSSGSGPVMGRCREMVKGSYDFIKSGRLKFTFWFGRHRKQAEQLQDFIRKLTIPAQVINEFREGPWGGIRIICDEDLPRSVATLFGIYREADFILSTGGEIILQAAASNIPMLIHSGNEGLPDIQRGVWEKANADWAIQNGFAVPLPRGERKHAGRFITSLLNDGRNGVTFRTMMGNMQTRLPHPSIAIMNLRNAVNQM